MTDETTTDAAERPATDPLESAMALVGRTAQLRGQAVYAGVKLGVVDLVGNGPKSAAEVASTLDLADDHTERLLRALSVYGVLDEDDGRFALTPVGERFRTDHAESVRDYLMFYYDPRRFAAVRHLPEVVADGDATSYDLEFDKGMFELFQDHPAFGEVFNGMQDLSSLGETARILETLSAVDFSQFSTVCDVGGGYGDLLCRLLDRHPHLEGTVLELESVLAEEDRLWAPKLGVEDRCEYVAGDMFDAVPRADAYILKAILHDWSDEDCVQILSTVHDAAPADGRLFVKERIVSEADPDPATIDMDVWMMLETGGRERTRAEFTTLFRQAGWTIDEVLAVEEGVSIMICGKD